MRDEDKTKKQLIKELAEMRQRIAELERAETELKQAEEELKRYHEHLGELIEARTAELKALNKQLQREIDNRKWVEEMLRLREEHFRLLVENAPDIIATIDSNQIIKYASPSTERILGYKPENYIGRNIIEFVHPDDSPAAIDYINKAIQNPGITDSLEHRLRHQNGSWRIFQSFGRSVLGDSGNLVIVINSRDITEQKGIIFDDWKVSEKTSALD